MILDFKYLGLPKKGLNNEVTSIEVEENTNLKKLLDEISERYNISKDIFNGCSFMVNNKRCNLKTKLRDGDYIIITKPLGGG